MTFQATRIAPTGRSTSGRRSSSFRSHGLPPESYINFGGEDRERVEHFSTPLFGLTPRTTTTYDLHRLLFSGDLHIGDSFRTFIQFSDHAVTSASLSPGTDVDQLDL